MQQKFQKYIQAKNNQVLAVIQKLTDHDERTIIRALHYACEHDGNFTSKRIQIYPGLFHIHDRTVRRVLNKYGYHIRLGRKAS